MQPIKNRTLEDHKDKFGLLTQRDWKGIHDFDGGDTAHREGMLIALLVMLDPNNHQKMWMHWVMTTRKLLRHPVKKGLWRRHADTNYFYGDWDRFSRDQAWEITIAMAVLGSEQDLDDFYWGLFKRFGFTSNTRQNGATAKNHGEKKWSTAPDLKWWEKLVLKYKIPIISVNKHYRNYAWKLPDFAGPELWSVYFRFKMKKRPLLWFWARAFVWLGEIESLGNSLLKVNSYGKDRTNYDDTNHIMPVLYAKWMGNESWIAKKSRRYYFHNRPFAGEPIMLEYEVGNGPMSALRKYFDGNLRKRSASPPLDRLAEPLVNAMGD